MAGTAIKTLTISGVTGEVYECQLAAPTSAEPIEVTTLADSVGVFVENIKKAGPLSLQVVGVAVGAGDKATLAISGVTTAGDAVSASVAGWVSSSEPSTVAVDGERRVSTACEFHPFTTTAPAT